MKKRLLLLALLPLAAPAQTFMCGTAAPKSATALSAATLYADAQPFGFDLHTAPTRFGRHSCTGDRPFFFSIAAHDGNYRVSLTLGSDDTASTTTLRAESRRLLLDHLAVPRGASRTVSFIINVRTPPIAGSDERVHLKPRELGALDWDNKLTLEFNGDHPSFRSLRIEPVAAVPTVYLAGDSTVVDQDKEPWAAWGQMLPSFFNSGIAVSNQAESGETIRSFEVEKRWAKIFSTLRSGDFLLIQFAHNDQKPGPGNVPAATEYKDLLRKYIAAARDRGATPILVTSMNRRKFDSGKIVPTLAGYPQAMREVAAEQHVALIDLTALSQTLFEAMGEEGTLHAFVHFPANTFPDQPQELKDDTHFTSYGAYELARAIVQSIGDQRLPLANFLRPDIPPFNPAHPDPWATFQLPPSPFTSAATPYGR